MGKVTALDQIAHDKVFKFGGALWFSKKQWKQLRDEMKPRTFARKADGVIVEYTEMMTYDFLEQENEMPTPIYDDAEFRGEGVYDHRIDHFGNKLA